MEHRIIGVDPAYSACYARAMSHLKKSEYAQAIAAFTEAMQLDPAAPNPYLGRAFAYRAVDNQASAARDEAAAKELGGAEQTFWDRLVNRAYQRAKSDLRFASRGEFYQQLPPLQRQAVLLRELQNQVYNGGFPQWVQNGYGAWIQDVIDAVKQVGTDTAREIQAILEEVSTVLREDIPAEAVNEATLSRLLACTDRYYNANVSGQFGRDVEKWLDEQVLHPS